MYEFLTILARTSDELNRSPFAKYFMIAVMTIGGPLILLNGVRGLRKGEITVKSKRGSKDYTGKEAVLAAWVQIGLGALFFVVGLFTLIFR